MQNAVSLQIKKIIIMKVEFYTSILLLFLTFSFFACNNNNAIEFSVKNSTDINRTDVRMVISTSEITELIKTAEENQTIAVKNISNEFIPFQIDTLAENQVEIAFVINLKANEETKVNITLIDKSELPEFQKFTNVRLGKDANFDGSFDDINEETRDTAHKPQAIPVLYQMEGIAWENDKVGFRSYWDSRNGKDIFGKLIETPVLDTVGLPESKSYHEYADWGMDILKVGSSLGAGAIALLSNDSIYRLGQTKSAHFKLITEGPIRAIFDMEYKGWIVDNKEYSIRERITIWKGKYYYHSNLFLEGSKNDIELITGITNIHTDTSYTLENENFKVLYTHGKQSENKDILGMALLIPSNNFIEYGVTANENTGVSHTYYTKMKIFDNQPTEFYFVAAWEKTNNAFADKLAFEEYIKSETFNLNNPITLSKKK